MEKSVVLSKIVASPTESTWSQAYSTLNLYIVLSLTSETPQESIVTEGKELLERIQREYFSLDDKNLSNIKKSIENATANIEDKNTISIILATITDNILYIIVAGTGSVVLKRGKKVGLVAEEKSGEISAFSGNLETHDIVILETAGFAQKVTPQKLTTLLDGLEVSEISENLAPLIHETPTGSEAAIILAYNGASSSPKEADTEPESEDQAPAEEPNRQEEQVDIFDEEPVQKSPISFKLPAISNPFKNLGTKKIVIISLLVLVIIFIGSVFYEKQRSESAKRQAELASILDPEQKKFDEATALGKLNKGLALDEFNNIKGDIEGKLSDFKAGTVERKKLEEFIGNVEGKIGELSQGSTLSNQKLVFDKGADLVAFANGTLAAVSADSGDVNILALDGSLKKTAQTQNKNVKAIAGDDDSVYVLGDLGVTKTDKKSGKTTNAISNISNTISIAPFGSNLYGLNTKTKTVDKYIGQSSPRSDYFKGSVTLSNPNSMAIDGSIWIIDAGKIRKFTKGSEETFTVAGLTKDISSNSDIYTDSDYTSVYVLDKNKNRIISIAKSGDVKNQYVSKDLSNATSFTVDETGKKIYVVISGKLYSFDL